MFRSLLVPPELHDLAANPAEARNLAAAHPADIAAVQRHLPAAHRPHAGLHRCTMRDYQPWNTQYHRRGLLKADDTPYPLLVDYTRRTNAQVHRLVYSPQP